MLSVREGSSTATLFVMLMHLFCDIVEAFIWFDFFSFYEFFCLFEFELIARFCLFSDDSTLAWL